MKKVLSLLTCLTLLFCLTACSAGTTPSASAGTTAAETAAPATKAETAAPTAAPTAKAPETTVPATEAPETTAPAAESLPEIQDKTDKVKFADFKFKVNGTEVTNATLAGLHIYKISVKTVNSKGNPGEATYGGYRLSDVLEACGLKNVTKVTAIADDGYTSELDAALINSEYTLVAIEKDKETGKNGTIWLAPCSETVSGSYCKLVVELKAE